MPKLTKPKSKKHYVGTAHKVGCFVSEASLYGFPEAVMLNNIRHWVKHNRDNNKNYREGRYWTYNSYEAFHAQYPFWTTKQVRRILKSLVDQDVLIKKSFGVSQDRTLWYTLKNTKMIDDPAKEKNTKVSLGF